MTLLQPRQSPRRFTLTLGAAVGRTDDFFVLGYSEDYDEIESARHPDHEQSSFILRYRQLQRHVVQVVPQRLNDLWRSSEGQMYAVGEPRGVLHVQPQGVTELAIDDVPGTFGAIWGSDEAHVHACGHYDPFWLYRRSNVWHYLPLPADVGGLWGVSGHHHRDVYAVSDAGEILHFDGAHVHRLDSPTTQWLVGIAPMPEARMCIGGHDGILLYGSVDGWRTVDSGTHEPLLNLVPYQGGVCFIAPEGVWHFDGRTAPRLLVSQGGGWISGVGEGLLIVDDDRAFLYDGAAVVPLDTVI